MTALLVVTLVVTLGTVRVLQVRWGFESVIDVLLLVVAMAAPSPNPSPQALVRKIGRRLPGVSIASVTGSRATAGTVRIYLSPASRGALDRAFPLRVLADEFGDAYLKHGERQGWRRPIDGVHVEFHDDTRLRSGWLRIDAIPGQYSRHTPGSAGVSGHRRMSGAHSSVAGRDDQNRVPTRLLETELQPPQLLWRLAPPDGTGTHALPLAPGDQVIIGRDATCGLVLGHKQVSRQHAALEVLEEAVYVKDLGSTNGTWVNGARLANGQRVPLVEGAQVRFARSGPTLRLTRLHAAGAE